MRRGVCAASVGLVVWGAVFGAMGPFGWVLPFGSREAFAQDAPVRPREAARAAFERAERAANELRFQEALDAYDEAFSRDPSAPFAPTARVRATELRSHAEGGFAPLARLEAVRRDPAKNRDAETIAALDREARAFPDGRVRSEALLVVAQAYAHVLDAPDRAVAALEAIAIDSFASRSTRALALSEVVALHRARGDLRGATSAVERDPELLPSVTQEVRAEVRRGRIATACFAALAGLGLAAIWGVVRAFSRRRDVRAIGQHVVRPGALAFAFYVGGGGAIFVRLHSGEGDPMPFLGLGLGIAAVGILVRLWSLADAQSTRARAMVRAAFGVLGVLAVAYLVLWRSGGTYLAPLGL